MATEKMTLRKLCEMLGPEYLDADLSFIVRDAHRNTAYGETSDSLWDMPRTPACAATGEPARLNIKISIRDMRLVKVSPPVVNFAKAQGLA